MDVLFLEIFVHEDGEEVFIVFTHISETGSGKEEVKLLFCFLVGFYDSSSHRLLNGRFECKSSLFLIAGFFGLIWTFVVGKLFFHNSFFNFFFMLLIEFFFEFFLKLAIVFFCNISFMNFLWGYWLNHGYLRIFVLVF